MDTYSKSVLTIIVGALVVLAVKSVFKPQPAYAFLNGPTLGEWSKALADKNPSTDPIKIAMRAPLVAVCDTLLCKGWSQK